MKMSYPIIMNGDHAEFEREHTNTPLKERPDWPLPSFDAKDWAKAFCRIANSHGFKNAKGETVDEDWMIGWFANALMRGFDEHAARTKSAHRPHGHAGTIGTSEMKQRRTLADYRELAVLLSGKEDSRAVQFFDDKIKAQGEDAPVLADEFQMMQLMASLLRKRG
jgi:hypothetical protein